MSWQDSLVSVTYTAPSGKAFTFHYDNGLQRETDLKTATFTFPSKDGAYIQPLGRGGRRFPFTCSFYGADCIKEADAYEDALCEAGYGELQYPTGKKYKVVPTGTIKRSDNLVSSANKSVVEITFAETLTDEAYPANGTLANDAIENAAADFTTNATAEFVDGLHITNTSELLNAKSVLSEQGRIVSESLDALAKMNPENYADFTAVKTSWLENIKGFANDIENVANAALLIAGQAITLIRMPSKIAIAILAKIEGYTSIATALAKNFARDPVGLNNLKNQYAATKLQLQALTVAIADGAAAMTALDESDGGFASREDAVTAAVEIADLADSVQEFCDAKIETIQTAQNAADDTTAVFAETAGGYSAMQEVVRLAVSHIINHSFTLKTRRIVTLDRERQILELLAELYGTVDDHIDEFIRDNNLNINEIALLPQGREIAYYE